MSGTPDVRWDETRGQWFSSDGRTWNGSEWVSAPYEASALQPPPRPTTPVYRSHAVRYLLLGVVAAGVVVGLAIAGVLFAYQVGWL